MKVACSMARQIDGYRHVPRGEVLNLASQSVELQPKPCTKTIGGNPLPETRWWIRPINLTSVQSRPMPIHAPARFPHESLIHRARNATLAIPRNLDPDDRCLKPAAS